MLVAEVFLIYINIHVTMYNCMYRLFRTMLTNFCHDLKFASFPYNFLSAFVGKYNLYDLDKKKLWKMRAVTKNTNLLNTYVGDT